MKSKTSNKLTRTKPLGELLAATARNMTIRHKLVLIIMLTCVATLIIAGGIFTGYEWTTLRQLMVMNLSAQAETMAETCKAAVAFDDSDDAREALSSLWVSSSIIFGGVYNSQSNLMSAYYRYDTDEGVLPDIIREDDHEFNRDYLTIFKRIILDGDVIGTVCIRSDLEDMIKKLNQSNQQLQDFTYVASHDLREPLRKISAFGQLLIASLGEKLEDDDRENLDFMIDGAERMQQMIEALLTYSRVTTKGIELETVDLNEVVEELQSFELSVKIEETKTNLVVPEPLHQVSCDPAQIRQLLQNLIANGLKYQKQGTIPEITIRSHMQDDGMLRVEVKDNGIGIEKEQCENVFVMFRRLHSRQEYEGTGIGLAACKKIAERHGGNIGVDSVYGEGSIFWFTMPSAQASPIEANSEADTKAVV